MTMSKAALKRWVRQRAHDCCEYCLSQEAFSTDPFADDHIMPQVQGGTSDANNLAFSCLGCNGHKFTATKARDPLTGAMAPLFHPRTDRWKDHFAWEGNFSLMVGRTPTGRATVERLLLNRPNLVNLRTALATLGKHPPGWFFEEE